MTSRRKNVLKHSLETAVGRCWASQEIRKAIQDGQIIVPNFSEGRIQPSSFEPTIGDEAFLLDTESQNMGLFSPEQGKTVYQTLLELPSRKRPRIDLQKDPVLRHGFSYLIPLQERFAFREPVFLRASTKSSVGRTFAHARTLVDCVSNLDEAALSPDHPHPLQSWLLVQPLKFDVRVAPGLPLHQLRIFVGHGAKLSASELYQEIEVQRRPFLYVRNEDGQLVPARHEIRESGINLHIDLQGKDTHGIVALRARANTNPIDLTQTGGHNPLDYFEPLCATNKGTFVVEPGCYYLFASHEVFAVPVDRNVELDAFSDGSFRGPRQFAGFVDNGFPGDLVSEFRSDEPTPFTLRHGDAFGRLHVFRTKKPDKLYGAVIGSNYHAQYGPRVAKYFSPLDYALAGKSFSKLEQQVMVHDARFVRGLFPTVQGFSFLDTSQHTSLFQTLSEHFLWHSRYDCETDELLRQPIPYLVLFGQDGRTVFSYQRADNRQHSAEARLHNNHSLGIGGHIYTADGPNYFQRGLERELHEEVQIDGTMSSPQFAGVMLDDSNPVGRVHFGLIYVARLFPGATVTTKETALLHGKMKTLSELTAEYTTTKYESWSKELIPHLQALYTRT